jgi:hypothetical protein
MSKWTDQFETSESFAALAAARGQAYGPSREKAQKFREHHDRVTRKRAAAKSDRPREQKKHTVSLRMTGRDKALIQRLVRETDTATQTDAIVALVRAEAIRRGWIDGDD